MIKSARIIAPREKARTTHTHTHRRSMPAYVCKGASVAFSQLHLPSRLHCAAATQPRADYRSLAAGCGASSAVSAADLDSVPCWRVLPACAVRQSVSSRGQHHMDGATQAAHRGRKAQQVQWNQADHMCAWQVCASVCTHGNLERARTVAARSVCCLRAVHHFDTINCNHDLPGRRLLMMLYLQTQSGNTALE